MCQKNKKNSYAFSDLNKKMTPLTQDVFDPSAKKGSKKVPLSDRVDFASVMYSDVKLTSDKKLMLACMHDLQLHPYSGFSFKDGVVSRNTIVYDNNQEVVNENFNESASESDDEAEERSSDEDKISNKRKKLSDSESENYSEWENDNSSSDENDGNDTDSSEIINQSSTRSRRYAKRAKT